MKRVFPIRFPIKLSMVAPPALEMPRLPVSRFFSHEKYCMYQGLSRPSCSLSAARDSLVACWPSLISAASPGRTCVRANIRIETTHNKMRPTPILRAIIRHIIMRLSPTYYMEIVIFFEVIIFFNFAGFFVGLRLGNCSPNRDARIKNLAIHINVLRPFHTSECTQWVLSKAFELGRMCVKITPSYRC